MNAIKLFSINILVFTVLCTSCNKTNHHNLVITNANIIDIKTGEILENRSIAIDSNRISAIYLGKKQFGDSTYVIDVEGKYIIPGLWDMHAHYYWYYTEFTPLLIANGVVGLREMRGNLGILYEIRKKAREGKIMVPDIYTSGGMLNGEDWDGSMIVVEDTNEAKRIVLDHVKNGVDFIKINSGLDSACYHTLMKTAHEHNIPVSGHITNSVSFWPTINAGQRSIEHFDDNILLASSRYPDSVLMHDTYEVTDILINTFSNSKFDSLCKIFAQSSTWLCPTMIMFRGLSNMNNPDYTNDPRMAYLSEDYTFPWLYPEISLLNYLFEEESVNEHRKSFQFKKGLLQKMNDSGVKLLAGTDCSMPFVFPGFSLHDELAIFVDAGMSELDALKTATINGAECMNNENDFGSVEEGTMASFLILKENPLKNIEHTKSIETVILRGEVLDKKTLNNMLTDAKTYASKISVSNWLRNKIYTDNLEQAFDSLDIVLANDSDFSRLKENEISYLGYEFLFQGDISVAKALMKKNLELFPDHWNVNDSYAEILMINGEYDESIKYYKKSFELNPFNKNAEVLIDSMMKISKL